MHRTRDHLESILARLDARAADELVFLRVYHAAARAAADAADARREAGISLGPLDGRIVSIKDLLDVAGEPTTAGSTLLRNAAPAERDATVVRRLRRAGAVIIGKTNMVEFAFSGVGLNPHYGTPGNAADPSRIPGGSSSGAGVSVGEGTSEIAIGSDTGGSVRIPAGLNGLVGFKPTAKRVPLDGAFPLSYSLDSLGPLALSVQDCADTDAVMAGEEPHPVAPLPVAGLRIGVPRGRLFGETEPVVAEAFEAVLRQLSEAGARIAEHGIDDLLAGMARATAPASIASIEAAEVHADWLVERAAEFDPRVQGRILQSGGVSAPIYLRMMRQRAALAAGMDERLASVDVLALPTTPIVAAPIEPLLGDDALYTKTNLLLLRNTMVANQFDLTSITLPVPGQRLPVGFMLVARHGEDHRLLQVAAGVEALLRSRA